MRINLFGGPGSGKSTTAAWLFSELKLRNYSIEYVSEYVKSWAYQKRAIGKFDQVYLFGKQQQYEFRYLNCGVKNIITDSPTLLAVIYAGLHGNTDMAEHLHALNKIYDKDWPCVNIFLDRGDKPYIQEGRYQTLEQAKELDNKILNILDGHRYKYNYKDKQDILGIVLKCIEK